MSIKKIAEQSGVSLSTVSHVLNGTAKISESVRDRVMTVARESGYLDSRIRRAMQPTLKSVMLVASADRLPQNDTNYVSWTILESLRKECVARGVQIKPLVTEGKRLTPGPVLSRIKETQSDGIIVYFDENPELLEAVSRLDRPALLLAGQDPTMRVGSVGIGNRYGARLGVQHLLDLGHRNIALVGWPGRYTIRQRQDGYSEAIRDHEAIGARGSIIMIDSFEPEEAASSMRRWLEENGGLGDLTAMFCLADNIAIGVIQALKERGYRVPQDVSVLGFDDILRGQMMDPPLSTVHAPLAQIGRMALDEMEYCLRTLGEHLPARRVELGCTIVERGSCAPLATAR